VALLVAVAVLTGCGRLRDGDVRLQLTVGGRARSYVLHRPAGAPAGQLLPVVLAFHGGFGDGAGMATLTHLDTVADEHGFLAVYPEGYQRSWNDGRGNTPAERAGIDDVAFVAALVDRLVRDEHADPRRVYATGISNGGIFTERLGCELADRIAAIAPVAGPMPTNLVTACHPVRPISVLEFHGTADPLVPYTGGRVQGRGGGGDVASVDATGVLWRQADGCAAQPDTRQVADRVADGTHLVVTTALGCPGGLAVVLDTLTGAGHTWPGGLQYAPRAFIGSTSRQLDASDAIWAFFAAHAR
jgi:polyhydroxybutyrate depolymerase